MRPKEEPLQSKIKSFVARDPMLLSSGCIRQGGAGYGVTGASWELEKLLCWKPPPRFVPRAHHRGAAKTCIMLFFILNICAFNLCIQPMEQPAREENQITYSTYKPQKVPITDSRKKRKKKKEARIAEGTTKRHRSELSGTFHYGAALGERKQRRVF